MKFGITTLQFQNFRSFERLRLENLTSINILIAPNGSGKTNILEAISILSPGKGMRGADALTMTRAQSLHPYQVGLTLCDTEEGTTHLGATYILNDQQKPKRIFKQDGEHIKNQSAFHDLFSVHWLTPSMDRMVAEEGGVQRAFVDRLTFAFYPNHARVRTTYDKLVRERNIILKEYGPVTHAVWLDKIEENIARQGIDILRARHDMCARLMAHQGADKNFLKFHMKMHSDAEEILSTEKINRDNKCVEFYREELLKRRVQDAKRGITSFGPHRSKLHVHHLAKNISGEFCSTGEQKMLLLAMILAFAKNNFLRGVVLLLDDVVDHLDARHRQAFFEALRDAQAVKDLGGESGLRKLQIFLTGANEAPFEGIKEHAFCLREHDLVRAAT